MLERILNKFYLNQFYKSFSNLNLIKAYQSRYNHFTKVYKITDQNLKERILNYFDVMEGEIDKVLKLNASTKSILDMVGERNIINSNDSINRIITNKIIYCGPSTDLELIETKNYDFIVFNKPIDLDRLKIPPEKVILILNNQWSIQKKAIVINWFEKYKSSKIFSPNRLRIKNEENNIVNPIKKYPFKISPMGLQRSLIVLLKYYDFTNLVVLGFNFSLVDDPYKKWYPSLIKHNYGSFGKGLLTSNMYHDFLFNFMFVKKLKQSFGNKIYGSIDPYLEMPIGDVIELFEKKRKALKYV